ncbi:MAG: PIN domain-containing protein [Candidatus Thermoplasmatota archaeon]|jgi:predicted nucleic acid-binding protein|nr:PIN domain-containing protein [Candidatus Thermoplasmatota archaeon]
MTVLIDTNVLLYDTIENSPYHNSASELIDVSEDPIINSLSIVELGFVLPRYGIDNQDVQVKINELLHGDYFSVSWISGKMIEKVSAFMVENKLSFRDFNDWIIAYDAHSRNVPLATFDKVLQNKCKKLGIQVIEI